MLLDRAQATILDAVLPVWSNPHMAATSVAGSGIVTHILKKCTEETKPLPGSRQPGAAARGDDARPPPSCSSAWRWASARPACRRPLRRVSR